MIFTNKVKNNTDQVFFKDLTNPHTKFGVWGQGDLLKINKYQQKLIYCPKIKFMVNLK